MPRPKGSKNKVQRTPRHQVQIRLSDAEHGTMIVAAELRGQTFGEWARAVLRQAAGLPGPDVSLPPDGL